MPNNLLKNFPLTCTQVPVLLKTASMCHNDLHADNSMVGEYPDGTPIPDSVQIIDFDNAEHGFMAWDFEYNWFYWPYPGPTEEQMRDFVSSYLTVWNAESDQKKSVDDVMYECDRHRPYALMENMLFRRKSVLFKIPICYTV